MQSVNKSKEIRKLIIKKAIDHVADSGWTEKALKEAAKDLKTEVGKYMGKPMKDKDGKVITNANGPVIITPGMMQAALAELQTNQNWYSDTGVSISELENK